VSRPGLRETETAGGHAEHAWLCELRRTTSKLTVQKVSMTFSRDIGRSPWRRSCRWESAWEAAHLLKYRNTWREVFIYLMGRA